MKKLVSVLLVAFLLIGALSISAAASSGWLLPYNVYISAGETKIVQRGPWNSVPIPGDLTVRAGGTLMIDGWVLVRGEITIDEGATVSGRNAWTVTPIGRWVVNNLLFGSYWLRRIEGQFAHFYR